jgi:glutaredoxin
VTSVAVYWAPGCHLCEPVKATARAVCAELGVDLRDIDISGDDALEAAYRASLPVVEIDGRRAFKYHLDEGEFRRRLARAADR